MTPERRDDPHDEVRVMREAKGLLIGLAIIALLVLVAGVAWTLTHR